MTNKTEIVSTEIVAIVGRPNVGKSVLFNKLVGYRQAITKDQPGVTRDLNYGVVEERGKHFTLIDTGGFEPETTDYIMEQVRTQSLLAVEEADQIIFVMDGREGLTHEDKTLADVLRKSGKTVYYVVNKLDTKDMEAETSEFYAIGVEEIIPLSAEHGIGISELLDKILDTIEDAPTEGEEEDSALSIAIVGRPNAGKSSLLNKIVGKERSIVSAVSGTTRDPIDTPFEIDGTKYIFIDTAGIRKKTKVSQTLENYCVVGAIKSIDRSDICLLVIDGKEGVSSQDEKIGGLIEDRGKSVIVVINKWDVVEKETNTQKKFIEEMHYKMPFLSYAPTVFLSALTGKNIDKLIKAVGELRLEGGTEVSTSELNRVLESITRRHHHPVYQGREVRFYYATQIGTSPPKFMFFCNYPEGVAPSYKRYMVNSLREGLNLMNVPIKVIIRKKT